MTMLQVDGVINELHACLTVLDPKKVFASDSSFEPNVVSCTFVSNACHR